MLLREYTELESKSSFPLRGSCLSGSLQPRWVLAVRVATMRAALLPRLVPGAAVIGILVRFQQVKEEFSSFPRK